MCSLIDYFSVKSFSVKQILLNSDYIMNALEKKQILLQTNSKPLLERAFLICYFVFYSRFINFGSCTSKF